MEENRCGFCHTGEETVDICGTLHKDTVEGKSIAAHHKCMQYSACLVQYKTDSFGGFKKNQVYDEIRRGGRLICSLCKNDKTKKNKKGATSGCALKNCRKTFHYFCVSMNPDAVAKRYRVAAGQKVVILYRVFCSPKHEELYRTNLKAEDVIGGQEDSSSDSEPESSHENQSRSSYDADTDVEPVYKKARTEEENEDTNEAASPMSAAEIQHQVQMEYSVLLQKNKSKSSSPDENGDHAGTTMYMSAAERVSGLVTDVSSMSESEGSALGDKTLEVTEGLYVVIPSKFDKTDLKSICQQVEVPVENCVLWPPSNDRKGLQDKHLPYVMWDITNNISQQDIDSLVSIFTDLSVAQYECMYDFHHKSSSQDTIFERLFKYASCVNCEYKKEVCRLFNVTDYSGKLHVLIVSLPRSCMKRIELSVFFHLYPWTSSTVASLTDIKPDQITYEAEKKMLVRVLRHKLRNKRVSLLSYPQDSVLDDSTLPCIAHSIEFKIETMALGLGGPVRVMIVRGVDRSVVQYKAYLHKLLQLFLHEGMRSESYCLLSVDPSDGIRTLSDVLPDASLHSTVQVFSAFDPEEMPVSCLLLYVRGKKKNSANENDSLGMTSHNTLESQASVYLDNAESQGQTSKVYKYTSTSTRSPKKRGT